MVSSEETLTSQLLDRDALEVVRHEVRERRRHQGGRLLRRLLLGEQVLDAHLAPAARA